jgi:hypothetical protein
MMNNQSVRDEVPMKKSYSRPRLRTIDLVPEQTLGVGCKDYEGLGAPGMSSDLCGGMAAACYADGS